MTRQLGAAPGASSLCLHPGLCPSWRRAPAELFVLFWVPRGGRGSASLLREEGLFLLCGWEVCIFRSFLWADQEGLGRPREACGCGAEGSRLGGRNSRAARTKSCGGGGSCTTSSGGMRGARKASSMCPIIELQSWESVPLPRRLAHSSIWLWASHPPFSSTDHKPHEGAP